MANFSLKVIYLWIQHTTSGRLEVYRSNPK